MLSNCPNFTNVGPRSSQTSRSRRGRSCGGDIVSQRNSFDRANNSLEVQRGDHILITVTHQARQDLPIAREISDMTDGFSNHGDIAFAGATERSVGRLPPTDSLARSRNDSDFPADAALAVTNGRLHLAFGRRFG